TPRGAARETRCRRRTVPSRGGSARLPCGAGKPLSTAPSPTPRSHLRAFAPVRTPPWQDISTSRYRIARDRHGPLTGRRRVRYLHVEISPGRRERGACRGGGRVAVRPGG